MVTIGERFLAFFHTTISKDKLKRHEIINFPSSSVAKTGSIPGLYIFENFVTAEEEQLIIKHLDEAEGGKKWQKLLNRRVQHYGFEFKYGTNNVDPDKSLG